jgi:hypothetical protein
VIVLQRFVLTLQVLCRHRIDFLGFNIAYTYRGGLKHYYLNFTNFFLVARS